MGYQDFLIAKQKKSASKKQDTPSVLQDPSFIRMIEVKKLENELISQLGPNIQSEDPKSDSAKFRRQNKLPPYEGGYDVDGMLVDVAWIFVENPDEELALYIAKDKLVDNYPLYGVTQKNIHQILEIMLPYVKRLLKYDPDFR